MSADIMRLVINTRNCNANAGLSRYKGAGIHQAIGRQHTGLRKVKKDDEETDNLKEKSVGKGINASTNTVENVDAVDSDKSVKVDEDSAMEAISNSSTETALDEDKKSILDDNDESTKVDEDSAMEALSNSSNETASDEDKESILDDKEKSLHDDKEGIQNEKELDEKHNEGKEASGVKRKYSQSVIDFLINNNNTDDTSIPVPMKLQRFDSSISDLQENDIHSITNSNDHDSHKDERISEQSTNHQLTLIPPTEGKKWPQKKCVYCRQKFGLRNDTRYICIQCNVAVCKPCFSDYHCNKNS